jgi:GNAT superfamily N-acetyltransferase
MIDYRIDFKPGNETLNALFADSWERYSPRDYSFILSMSLGHICAFSDDELIGFVYLAWDGGRHAFLLDPTVHPDFRRRGIGTELVRRAVKLAESRGAEWLHVDFEPQLAGFYQKCGFVKTEAGLISLIR